MTSFFYQLDKNMDVEVFGYNEYNILVSATGILSCPIAGLDS